MLFSCLFLYFRVSSIQLFFFKEENKYNTCVNHFVPAKTEMCIYKVTNKFLVFLSGCIKVNIYRSKLSCTVSG